MKYLIFSLLFFGLLTGCTTESNTKKKPLSPHQTTMLMIGDAHIHMDYSSPGVRGRKIFGDLIPYGKLWRAGANNATWLETNKDLMISEQLLPKGKYGVFIIPNKESWTWVFNKNWNQHGTDDYQKTEDVLRFEVPTTSLERSQEHLEYQVKKDTDDSGRINAAWEDTKVEFSFRILNQ